MPTNICIYMYNISIYIHIRYVYVYWKTVYTCSLYVHIIYIYVYNTIHFKRFYRLNFKWIPYPNTWSPRKSDTTRTNSGILPGLSGWRCTWSARFSQSNNWYRSLKVMNSRNISKHTLPCNMSDLVCFYLLYGFWMFLALGAYSTM